jgi:hypothetical protein
MKKYIISFFVVMIAAVMPICGEIFETHHFNELLSHVTPGSLVILDIDDTLLIPEQMLGCDKWFEGLRKKYESEGMTVREALEKSLAQWEAVRHLTKMEVVEPGTVEIVKALQDKGHCVMGLTTQGLALATRTALQLSTHHIDLSVTAPTQEGLYINLGDRKSNHSNHGALFRNGILFTSGMNKGEALFKLCDKIRYKPKKIIFINDKATHLAEVENVAKKRKVKFVGLRYAYSDARKESFREDIADLQFKQSTFGRFISDSEAMEILERGPTLESVR